MWLRTVIGRAKKRLRRLRRRSGLLGLGLSGLGAVLWLLDQISRWQTASFVIAHVKAVTAGVGVTEAARNVGMFVWNVLIDGRWLFLAGIALVTWALLRPEDLDELDGNEPSSEGLDVEAYGGATVVLMVKNLGQQFTLGVRARIVHATLPIDHSAPYEYKPRLLGTGETLSGFQIASISDEFVTIYGEYLNPIQHWRLTFKPKLDCQIRFTFYRVDGAHSRQIDERIISISATSEPYSHSRDTRLSVGVASAGPLEVSR